MGDRLVAVWVVGEMSVPEDRIAELGIIDATREAFEGTLFEVGYAEENHGND